MNRGPLRRPRGGGSWQGPRGGAVAGAPGRRSGKLHKVRELYQRNGGYEVKIYYACVL
jgi:hypothetical protein